MPYGFLLCLLIILSEFHISNPDPQALINLLARAVAIVNHTESMMAKEINHI